MNKRILLVGCGNIGSRHLQALVKLPFKTDIEIVEPNENAKKLAKIRLDEIPFKKSSFNIEWHSSLQKTKSCELVILATPSTNRVELIEELLKMGHNRLLIEKIVCQSDHDYKHLLSLIHSTNSKGWINTSRRYFTSYQNLKNQIQSNSKLNFVVNAGNMGLGSNALHFVDLFTWITNSKNFTLNGDYLDDKLLDNKRGAEFKEFSGTITGKSSNGSTLSINFLQKENIPVFVSIFDEKNALVIDETTEKIYDLVKQQTSEFKVEFQSTLTTKISTDILEKDDSFLPSLKESEIAHSELFRIFNHHIKKITHLEVEKCPIT